MAEKTGQTGHGGVMRCIAGIHSGCNRDGGNAKESASDGDSDTDGDGDSRILDSGALDSMTVGGSTREMRPAPKRNLSTTASGAI